MAIRLVPHDPDWADIYERAAADIRGALGSTALSVDHVGSTAIPGIVAKPVIDVEILVEAYDPEAPLSRSARVARIRVRSPRRESRLLRGSFDETPFHVHVVEESSDSRMMIKFRDYLRAHPDEARRYEDLKKAVGEQHDDANAYANAKSSYVLEIVRRAQ